MHFLRKEEVLKRSFYVFYSVILYLLNLIEMSINVTCARFKCKK